MADILVGQGLRATIPFEYQGPAGRLTVSWWVMNGGVEAAWGRAYVDVPDTLSFTGKSVDVDIPGSGMPGPGSYAARARVYYGTATTAPLLAEASYPTGTVNIASPIPAAAARNLAITTFAVI